MLFSDFIQIGSNRVTLLLIMASAAADRAVCALLGRVPGKFTLVATNALLAGANASVNSPRIVAPKRFRSMGPLPCARNCTGRGSAYLALKLNVLGMRSTRAASAVTVWSMFRPSCLHRRLKFSAIGFHVAMSTGAFSTQ